MRHCLIISLRSPLTCAPPVLPPRQVHALLFRRCGRHRSVVRLVGWLLPLPPVPRPRVRLIRSDSRWSMARSCSQLSLARSCSQLSLARSASQMSLLESVESGDEEPLSARPELCEGESPRADTPAEGRGCSFYQGDVSEVSQWDREGTPVRW